LGCSVYYSVFNIVPTIVEQTHNHNEFIRLSKLQIVQNERNCRIKNGFVFPGLSLNYDGENTFVCDLYKSPARPFEEWHLIPYRKYSERDYQRYALHPVPSEINKDDIKIINYQL
jgi:hypothetical protein